VAFLHLVQPLFTNPAFYGLDWHGVANGFWLTYLPVTPMIGHI
jgi:hypothetical protein